MPPTQHISLATPALDAFLPTIEDEHTPFTTRITARVVERFNRGRAVFEEALAERSIYNQELLAAKSDVNEAFELAIGEVRNHIWDKHEKEARRRGEVDNFYTVTSGLFQINHAPGRVKRLEKAIKKYSPRYPELKELLVLWQEVAQFNDAINALKPYIKKGRKPAEVQKPIDTTNMATCPICLELYKMQENRNLVHHGFQISNQGRYLGQRLGRCFGTDKQPYELSCEANRQYIAEVVQPDIERTSTRLKRLETGEITTLITERWVPGQRLPEPVDVHIGEEGFDRLLRAEINRTTFELERHQQTLEIHEKLIADWKLRPLPEGEIIPR